MCVDEDQVPSIWEPVNFPLPGVFIAHGDLGRATRQRSSYLHSRSLTSLAIMRRKPGGLIGAPARS
jgi:hypothetical protein